MKIQKVTTNESFQATFEKLQLGTKHVVIYISYLL